MRARDFLVSFQSLVPSFSRESDRQFVLGLDIGLFYTMTSGRFSVWTNHPSWGTYLCSLHQHALALCTELLKF